MKGRYICLLMLFFTSCVFAANPCDLLSSNRIFYDNTAKPTIALTIGPSEHGEIKYNNHSAPTQVQCHNGVVSVSWETTSLKGSFNAMLSFGGVRDLLQLTEINGTLNGDLFPYTYLSTKV